jgi:hypothetical protein
VFTSLALDGITEGLGAIAANCIGSLVSSVVGDLLGDACDAANCESTPSAGCQIASIAFNSVAGCVGSILGGSGKDPVTEQLQTIFLNLVTDEMGYNIEDYCGQGFFLGQ